MYVLSPFFFICHYIIWFDYENNRKIKKTPNNWCSSVKFFNDYIIMQYLRNEQVISPDFILGHSPFSFRRILHPMRLIKPEGLKALIERGKVENQQRRIDCYQ